MNKKSILLSQVMMTFMMALTMSGIMGLMAMGGPSMEWFTGWPLQFILAWPIALALTMVAWPLAWALTGRTLGPRRNAETTEAACFSTEQRAILGTTGDCVSPTATMNASETKVL